MANRIQQQLISLDLSTELYEGNLRNLLNVLEILVKKYPLSISRMKEAEIIISELQVFFIRRYELINGDNPYYIQFIKYTNLHIENIMQAREKSQEIEKKYANLEASLAAIQIKAQGSINIVKAMHGCYDES